MTRIEQLIDQLELRVDELIALCNDCRDQTHSQKAREDQLAEERANLMRKNDLASNKIEAMVSRLRALEQDG